MAVVVARLAGAPQGGEAPHEPERPHVQMGGHARRVGELDAALCTPRTVRVASPLVRVLTGRTVGVHEEAHCGRHPNRARDGARV